MYDVIVVGAGPAGSTVARYASKKGLRVLLIDRRKEIGVPVQCGEFVAENEEISAIFPQAGEVESLFSIPDNLKQRETKTIRIFSPRKRSYEIDFKGYSVNRDKFDKYLAELAEKEGAEIATRTNAHKIAGREVLTNNGAYQGKVIVGADGPISTVARSVGLPTPSELAVAITCQIEGDFQPVVHTYFGKVAPGGYAWIIPKKGCANVGLGVWQHFKGNIFSLLDIFLEEQGFQAGKAVGGLVPVSGPVGRTVKGNVLLVGDSAGHVMPTNGGGINVGMICARLAGDCIADHLLLNEPLERYEEEWRKAVGTPLEIGAKIKRLADRFFGNDFLLEGAMRLLGRKRMARVIRCQRPFKG